jgi:hypothetical protein
VNTDGTPTPKTAERTTFSVNVRTYFNEKATLYTVNPKKDDDVVINGKNI